MSPRTCSGRFLLACFSSRRSQRAGIMAPFPARRPRPAPAAQSGNSTKRMQTTSCLPLPHSTSPPTSQGRRPLRHWQQAQPFPSDPTTLPRTCRPTTRLHHCSTPSATTYDTPYAPNHLVWAKSFTPASYLVWANISPFALPRPVRNRFLTLDPCPMKPPRVNNTI